MRCAIYARVSTDLDVQKTSIDNQIEIFRKYASEHSWEIVNIYTDKKSGTKHNRPGLKALIEDGKLGKYDVILAKELSRLARNGRLSYELRDICLEHQIHIICLDNSVNTLEGNIQNFGLFAWLYENESSISSRRNKQAKLIKAENGKYIGSNPPYGYDVENGKLVVRTDYTPLIVQRIYNEYLSGIGMDTIAKKLSNEEIPSPSQVANKSNATPMWHGSTIKLILNNRHYCGDLVQLKSQTISVTSTKRKSNSEDQIVIENTHEPIISKSTYLSVQKLLSTRTRTTTAPKRHLFTNLLYCAECKRGMWFKANQKGYRCGGNIKHGNVFCENHKALKESHLYESIVKDLALLFKELQVNNVDTVLLKQFESKKKLIKNEISNIETEIQKLNKKKIQYYDLFLEKEITKIELEELRELVLLKIGDYQNRILNLNSQIEEIVQVDYLNDLKDSLNEFLSLSELTPQILHTFVKRIDYRIDGSIDIHYNFANPFIEE